MEETANLEAVVRGFAAAAKSLRLYPASSPIPMQAVQAAAKSLAAYLSAQQVLALTVARDGFTYRGSSVASSSPGTADLADMLRAHGIAEIAFTPGCRPEELMTFLTLIGRDPASVRNEGGVNALLASKDVENVRASQVELTVVEENIGPSEDQDADEFLRELAGDSEKLAMWMSAAAKADPETFRQGLEELAEVSTSDLMRLVRSMAPAFMALDRDGKDALLGLAMDPGRVQDLAGGMFGLLQTKDLAGSMVDGAYGANMLSLSSALTHLPFGEKLDDVVAKVREMLPAAGHTTRESEFLEHMLSVRNRTQAERPLIEADASYKTVADAVRVDDAALDASRHEVAQARETADDKSVGTMLTLLDQQSDFALYCRTLEALAATVPGLVERGRVALADRVVCELSERESRTVQPWPELTQKLREALAKATDARTMRAILSSVSEDASRLEKCRSLLRFADEQSQRALVEESLDRRTPGDLSVAEDLLGRRMLDLLQQIAPRAQWFQLGPIVQRLAREDDGRSKEALDSVIRRSDEQSRREAAQGLAAVGGAHSARVLSTLLSDPSTEVAIIAARGMPKTGATGVADMLSKRLQELDIDGKDFLLAREIIGALARTAEPAAETALQKLASRKTLIKRGHFGEITELARQGLAVRKKGSR